MSNHKIIFLIRIYDGSDIMSSVQNKTLEIALQRFQYFKSYSERGVSVQIERMSNFDVKNKNKHITKLSHIIDWLVEDSAESHVDAYFLPCHLHQGYQTWHESMIALKEDYNRLADHGNGCPDKYQIHCPVFTQDKFDYLKLIPEFVNPTLQIPVKELYETDEMGQIKAFWDHYCSSPSGGVIKAPFTTNGNWRKYPKNLKKTEKIVPSVEGVLQAAYNELDGSIPYVMMQPCIDLAKHKRERKIVFLGGKASHATTGFSKGSFPIDDVEVMQFAQEAYDSVVLKLGRFHWLDQLARVDVMYNEIEGRMVVNEIESVQACYTMKSSTLRSSCASEEKVENFLIDYYIQQLERLVVRKIDTFFNL